MTMWNPWRGCVRYSDGCKYCYIHKGDLKKGIITNKIVKTDDFYKPVERLKNETYKIKSGIVYVCFSSDFLIEEADSWRMECFKMMKERSDLTFLFLTKRIERFLDLVPDDWGSGYPNVVVCCTIENQEVADKRLAIFSELPIKKRCITAQPLLENIDIEKYLDKIELVVVGGESDYNARVFNYEWALNLRRQCIKKNVNFEFRQCGTNYIRDGVRYTLKVWEISKIAKEANINYYYKGEKNYE